MGMASRDIKAGDRILKDKIVLTLPRNSFITSYRDPLLQQLEELSEKEQEEFWRLTLMINSDTGKGSVLRAHGIMRNNSTTMNDTRDSIDLGLTIALINHSCLPNCVDHPTLQDPNIREIRAVEDIKEGEEITVSYETASMYENKAARQKIIKSSWDFDCICSRCAEGDVKEEKELKASMDVLVEVMNAAFDMTSGMLKNKRWENLAIWEDKQIDLVQKVSFASIQLPHELASLVKFAQLARRRDMIEKGMKL